MRFLEFLIKRYSGSRPGYVFKATNLGKQDLGVPQLLRKRYKSAVLA